MVLYLFVQLCSWAKALNFGLSLYQPSYVVRLNGYADSLQLLLLKDAIYTKDSSAGYTVVILQRQFGFRHSQRVIAKNRTFGYVCFEGPPSR